MKKDDTVKFDVFHSVNGKAYAGNIVKQERNTSIYNTEDKQEWVKSGLEAEYDFVVLASGVPSHILSGITDHFLSENWEPINEFLDCQQPRLANCLFLRCHRLNSLNLASLH